MKLNRTHNSKYIHLYILNQLREEKKKHRNKRADFGPFIFY